jgi:hypothetical protein
MDAKIHTYYIMDNVVVVVRPSPHRPGKVRGAQGLRGD